MRISRRVFFREPKEKVKWKQSPSVVLGSRVVITVKSTHKHSVWAWAVILCVRACVRSRAETSREVETSRTSIMSHGWNPQCLPAALNKKPSHLTQRYQSLAIKRAAWPLNKIWALFPSTGGMIIIIKKSLIRMYWGTMWRHESDWQWQSAAGKWLITRRHKNSYAERNPNTSGEGRRQRVFLFLRCFS